MRKIIFILLLFSGISLFAQDKEGPAFRYILETEEKLEEKFSTLYKLIDPEKRDSLNTEIIHQFTEALNTWDGFYYDWDKLQTIGRLKSSDGKLKVYTWYLPASENQYKYYGFLQVKTGRNKRRQKIDLYRLIDQSSGMEQVQIMELSPEKWFGALYFDVKTFHYRKTDYHVLMGYDFNDNLSRKKLLEVIRLDRKGKLEMGGTFHKEDEVFNRIIKEYSADITMNIIYDPKLDMIVFDHLVPFQPILSGNYRFYGPDGSYDGYGFEEGEFYFHEDVDARNN